MVHGIHPGHHRQQHLSRADVAGGLLATDVLLTRLQRHPQRGLPVGVARQPDDPPRQQALEFIARGEEAGSDTPLTPPPKLTVQNSVARDT